MAQFHFVEDYERHVAELVATKPIDEAMSLAVGGSYEAVGAIEGDLVRWAGLADGMALIDFGCGSGRLAHAISQAMHIRYLGIDIVQSLLDYAATKCPPEYRFLRNTTMAIPSEDDTADFVAAFSVFTHLLPSESYIYLEDIRRVLKPGGILLFTFLEFADPNHWIPFAGEVDNRRATGAAPLNTLLERPVIELWAAKLGFASPQFVGGADAPWGGSPMWQSTAILRNAK